MANDLKSNTLYGDTIGFLAKSRVCVLSIIWIPNSAGNAVTLSFFNEAQEEVAKKSALVTISSSSIITSVPTGGSVFPNTYAAGDAALIKLSGGQSKANEGLHLITTAGDNDHFHTEADLTDATAIPVEIATLKRKTFATLFTAAKDTLQFHFDKDTYVPNLAITSIAPSGIVLVQIA